MTLLPAIQSSGSSGPASTPGQGVAAAGAHVFEENCTPCHGDQGQGAIGPTLRNNSLIQTGNDQAIFNVIANGVASDTAVMPAWLLDNGGPLNASEINDAVAYLRTLQNVPVMQPIAQPTEEATEVPAPGQRPHL